MPSQVPEVVNWYMFPFIVATTRSYASRLPATSTISSDVGECTASTCAYTSSVSSTKRMQPDAASTISSVPLLTTTTWIPSCDYPSPHASTPTGDRSTTSGAVRTAPPVRMGKGASVAPVLPSSAQRSPLSVTATTSSCPSPFTSATATVYASPQAASRTCESAPESTRYQTSSPRSSSTASTPFMSPTT